MRAHEHTRSMLAWWCEIGIDRADLAVRRPSGAMIWHRDVDTTSLPLAQRWLAQRIAADLGSISGEHLGRLAGFKNWKRNGTWVNVLAATLHGRRWDPSVMPSFCCTEKAPPAPSRRRRRSTDTSPSGKEWGWVCGLLEAGSPPDLVYVRLLERARTRRNSDAPRYAWRTLERALERTGHAAARRAKPREMPRPNPEEVRLPKV